MSDVEEYVTFGNLPEGINFGYDEIFGKIVISNHIIIKEMHSKCLTDKNIATKIYKFVTEEYNGNLSNIIPQSTEELVLGDCFENHILKNLPPIKKLVVGDRYNKTIIYLPITITYLDLGDNFNCSIEHLINLKKLVYLRIGNAFKKDIYYYYDNHNILKSCLPSSLKILKLGNSFNNNLRLVPPTLKEFHVGHCFNKPIDGLPNSIEIIKIGDGYNLLIRDLPIKLKHLEIGVAFNKEIGYIPEFLKTLILGNCFFLYRIERLYMPESLKYIEIGGKIVLDV